MSIFQFLRIFWARRLIVAAAAMSCLIGALIVVLILPERWEASSRVMLNLLKPDPVTGEMMSGVSGGIYVSSQVELISDYTVARQVVEETGMLSDSNLIAAYNKRPSRDRRDMPHWAAQIVMDNTKAKLVQGSNILEISYTGSTGEEAQRNADAIRKAYMDASLELRREEAERNAEWYEQQSVKDQKALEAAVAARAEFERANGVIMTGDKSDIDTARLQSLSVQAAVAAPPSGAVGIAGPSAMDSQIAQMDVELAEASRILGPNNPKMQELRARRTALATLAAQEHVASRAALSAASSGQGAILGALASQKAKVIAQSDKIGRLNQLQSEADLRHEIYQRSAAKAAQFRVEAGAAGAGIIPLGSAAAPKAPSFPNFGLIIPGAIILGLGVGLMSALLMELFGRRVRSPEDLVIRDVPMIGVIARATGGRSPFRFVSPDITKLKFRFGRRKVARA